MAINNAVLADDVTTTDFVVRDYTLGGLYLGVTGAALVLSGLALVTLAAALPGGVLSTALVLTVGLGLLAASPAAARWAMARAFDLGDRPMSPSAAGPETPEERRRTAGSGADFWR